ncbi:hypothetical protein Dsin_022010 [Dipteronia sinensis]|uniref:Protein ALP1-like n=1 Tax=Dipteronia sinensis TaxID=43782 RepID=A0AAE0DZB6_9ROSI|nr:hypothetical protein Dsin_022010 [Dipteronia sinensis]
MGRSLFLRIVEKVEARDNYFVQRRDSVGRLGLSALQKITAVFRMLAYGCLTDASNEYIKIRESTTIESLKRFCRSVVEEFAGQYAGRSGSPTIILEAVADYDLWIWYAYFGLPGTNNDINVLEASHLFANLAQGIAPPAHYVIQGKEYNMGYYLADGIYPKWSTLVQTIHDPRGRKKNYLQ